MTESSSVICAVERLSVSFPRATGAAIKAIDDVSIRIKRGDAVGVVGESGSGKSLLALSILGLLPAGATSSGRVVVDGTNVLTARSSELRRIRGRTVGIILQDPTAALNPVRRIRSQLRESAVRSKNRADVGAALEDGLLAVGLRPDMVLPKYPFELSGGMNQRVAIAMALLQSPDLLIGDEPTTALDSSIQREILGLLREAKRERNMALLLISHDLAVVYQTVDTVLVMYAGKILEYGSAQEVISDARHPYTRALLRAVPALGSSRQRIETIPGQFTSRLVGDSGCPFRARCAFAVAECDTFPEEATISDGHRVWCWLYRDSSGMSPQVEL